MSFIFRVATKAAALGTTGLDTAAIYRYQEVKNKQSKLPTHQLCSTPTTTSNTSSNSANPNNPNKKNIIINGGGVVGITAAYKLTLQGHSITLLEPNSQPGKECSACATGGMQRSNPMVDQGTWVEVTKCVAPISRFILGGSDEPYKFFHICWLSTVMDPFFLRWSITFTKTSFFPCKEQKYLQKEMLTFTDYAVRDMIAMMEDKDDPMAVRSGYNPNGSLSLPYNPPPETKNGAKDGKDVANAPKAVKNPTRGNALEPSTTLTGLEITAREPSLLHQSHPPTTAKYKYESRATSLGRFTEELADWCQRDGRLDVWFFYDTKVLGATATTETAGTNGASGANHGSSVSSGMRRVSQLQTNRGVISLPERTEVVVAAGVWTSHIYICAFLDLYMPV